MCITGIIKDNSTLAPIIICHNRDEFHRRASSPLAKASDSGVIAGLDEKSGGHWLSLSSRAEIPYTVIVLNYRNFSMKNEEKKSRGLLVKVLSGLSSKQEAVAEYQKIFDDYSPHSILIADYNDIFIGSNQASQPHKVSSGITSFSNGLPSETWPKQKEICKLLKSAVSKTRTRQDMIKNAMDALGDQKKFPIEILPNTFVGEPMEIMLSSIFIKSSAYGTRSSYVIILDENGYSLSERSFDPEGNVINEQNFKTLKKLP